MVVAERGKWAWIANPQIAKPHVVAGVAGGTLVGVVTTIATGSVLPGIAAGVAGCLAIGGITYWLMKGDGKSESTSIETLKARARAADAEANLKAKSTALINAQTNKVKEEANLKAMEAADKLAQQMNTFAIKIVEATTDEARDKYQAFYDKLLIQMSSLIEHAQKLRL